MPALAAVTPHGRHHRCRHAAAVRALRAREPRARRHSSGIRLIYHSYINQTLIRLISTHISLIRPSYGSRVGAGAYQLDTPLIQGGLIRDLAFSGATIQIVCGPLARCSPRLPQWARSAERDHRCDALLDPARCPIADRPCDARVPLRWLCSRNCTHVF